MRGAGDAATGEAETLASGERRRPTAASLHLKPSRHRSTLQARNVVGRLPKPLYASVRRALRRARELDDADKGKQLLRNLARQLGRRASGVVASLIEGLDEMLTVHRLDFPPPLRGSFACTASIENMVETVRRVCRNVTRWRNAALALPWTAAGMMKAVKYFRRLKAY